MNEVFKTWAAWYFEVVNYVRPVPSAFCSYISVWGKYTPISKLNVQFQSFGFPKNKLKLINLKIGYTHKGVAKYN